ncbi:MAG: helix-turn-helix domain-containing protein [Xanthobacteraceae bacterium]
MRPSPRSSPEPRRPAAGKRPSGLPAPAHAWPDPRRSCGLARRLAAGHYEVPLADITAKTRRSRRASRARHVAIYLAHVALGLPLGAVAAEFRRDRTTAEYACRVVEDARDDPAFDAALAGLELTAGILLEFDRNEGKE